mmetsp:Transcript_61248/g.164762  ORF Transcript_61248/g.164762 Transcript_61248/m.164762 type:complete len:179 (+) Transcript_61248:139-675(+)
MAPAVSEVAHISAGIAASRKVKLDALAISNFSPSKAYERLGMEQLWLPTIDHYEPRLEDLQQACDFIERYRAKGERVYIHCKAGHDRSAAVALAWMAYSRRVLNEEDLRLLNEELFEKRQVRATLYEQPNLQAFAEWIRHGGADRTWERPAGLSAELAEAAAAAATIRYKGLGSMLGL